MTSRPSRLTPSQRGILIALSAAVIATAVTLGVVLALTSDSDPILAGSTTVGTPAPTTTPPPPQTTTTVADTTTTTIDEPTTTTTTVEDTTTTTTIEIRDSFVLRPDGIDRLFFGSDPEDVISDMTERLGEPTSDTDWVDQNERFDGLCGGTEARFVTWESLQLFFTDRESAWAPAGTRHFASFSVEEGVADLEFATSRGVGLGSTVAEIADAYGDDVAFGIQPAYEAEVFELDPPGDGYLIGFLTGLDDDDTVIEIVGGFSCGE
jgi:hypothetical protein